MKNFSLLHSNNSDFKISYRILYCTALISVFFKFNEPELGAGIDPGMALTPLPSSI